MKKKKTVKVKTNDVYENISSSLDTIFDGEETKEIVEVKEQLGKCSDLMNNDMKEIDLDDATYIRDEIKNLIGNLNQAMDKLQQELKIGSTARQNEVFGQLGNAKTNALKELTTMNKVVLEARVKLRKGNTPKNMTVNNLNLTSSDLLKLVNNAKKNNSLKDIEANFKIADEKME